MGANEPVRGEVQLGRWETKEGRKETEASVGIWYNDGRGTQGTEPL